MKRTALILCLIAAWLTATAWTFPTRRTKITDGTGTPSGYPYEITTPNSTVTDDGDQTYTLDLSGYITAEDDPTVDTEAECETEWGGVNILLETEIDASSELGAIMDDETGTGALVFGTDPAFTNSINIPNGTDPDVDAEGEITYDTDDDSLRGYDGTNQVVLGKKVRTIQFTIAQPDDLDETDDIPVFSNETGFSFIITEIKAWCDDQAGDDGDFTLVETSSSDFDTETTIEAVTCSTDGTSVDYTTVASGDIDHTTIENGNLILFDPTTDDLKWVKVTIKGYLDADVP